MSVQESIVVGMSGGVDSAVAALLLKRAGRPVRGLFMKNWDEDDGTEYCTARADLEDAQRVCDRLDIELHTANFAAEYWDRVFAQFLAEYTKGRTPNPDVLCNREIKFNVFLDYARQLGATRIATGHYVRASGSGASFRLSKGIDSAKDQSYFLQAVPAAQLAHCLFPLGELYKPDVRTIAAEAGLHNHARKDSTGICFIGERRFADFLARYVARTPGPIRDAEGRTRGEHVGLAYYTIGQRAGLGIGGQADTSEAPWYVVEKDLRSNTLFVSQQDEDLCSGWLATPAINWLVPVPTLPLRCAAKIRYRQTDQSCRVEYRAEGSYRVTFDRPQRAATPGQYVCLYDGDTCLGGGVIDACGPARTSVH
jgi:tRNA-specific 2-thiouridylase